MVAPSSSQIRDQFKQCQVMVIFKTDPSGATCRLRDYSSYGLNIWVRCASGNVFGQVMSPHHSDQMSQESQVSLVSLQYCEDSVIELFWTANRPPKFPVAALEPLMKEDVTVRVGDSTKIKCLEQPEMQKTLPSHYGYF